MDIDRSCSKLGPVWLAPGISRFNASTYLYASFVCIAFISLINVLQAYILTEHLAIPDGDQGTLTGDLALFHEIITLLLFAPAGILSDRIGRRPVFVFGMVLLFFGFALYPLATSTLELTVYRCIYAVGTACVGGMIGTLSADYPQEMSRGKLIAISGALNGLGIVVFAGVSGRLPQMFRDKGIDAVMAGRYTFWLVAAICLISTVILQIGLKGGTPAQASERTSFRHLITSGFKQARNPRIALAYGTAFAARADLVVVGTFVTLWAVQAGTAQGLSTQEALAKGTLTFVIAQTAAICWAPFMGFIIDRFNRVTAQAVAMVLAGSGYLSMALVSSPLDSAALCSARHWPDQCLVFVPRTHWLRGTHRLPRRGGWCFWSLRCHRYLIRHWNRRTVVRCGWTIRTLCADGVCQCRVVGLGGCRASQSAWADDL